jgi:hypothetical protein
LTASKKYRVIGACHIRKTAFQNMIKTRLLHLSLLQSHNSKLHANFGRAQSPEIAGNIAYCGYMLEISGVCTKGSA